jgi:hypothetical protein
VLIIDKHIIGVNSHGMQFTREGLAEFPQPEFAEGRPRSAAVAPVKAMKPCPVSLMSGIADANFTSAPLC